MASQSAAVLLIQYSRTQSLRTFFACDVGSKSTSCSSDISSPLGLLTVRRCLRFLRTTLKGVWITYDRGVGLLPMTFPGVFHPFGRSNFTWTESPGCRLERGRTPCLVSKSWRYAVLDCSSFLAAASWFGGTGFKLDSNVGRRARISLPIISWHGLTPVNVWGVARYDISARKGSCCFSIFLAMRTPLSASPFACGKYGLVVVCLKSYSWLNLWNWSEANWGPLSLTPSSSIPYRAKTSYSLLITASLVVIDVKAISGNLK